MAITAEDKIAIYLLMLQLASTENEKQTRAGISGNVIGKNTSKLSTITFLREAETACMEIDNKRTKKTFILFSETTRQK